MEPRKKKIKLKVYPNGLPFSNIVKLCLDEQILRVKQNKASLIIIDGGIGMGKSTLGKHFLNYINSVFNLPPASLDKKYHPQWGTGGEEFMGNLGQCYNEKLPAIVYDEGGDFDKRTALTKYNRLLNRTFDTFRAFKIIVIIALPCFDALDNPIFVKGIPRILFNVKDRSMTTGTIRIYNLYRMLWIKHNMKKIPIPATAYNMTRPFAWATFLNLEEEEKKELDKLSTSNKLDILKENAIDMGNLISYTQIAKECFKSVPWVRKKVKELKIKHKKILKKAKYFDRDYIMNILSDYLK